MDTIQSRIGAVRLYVYDYAVGTLWIIVAAAAVLTGDRATELLVRLNAVIAAAPLVRLPNGAATFLVLLLGVVIPYCVALIARPFTIAVMEVLYQRQFASDEDQEGRRAVLKRIQAVTDTPSPLSWMFLLTFLELRSPTMAQRMRHDHEHLVFRGAALLPSSIILGLICWRATLVWLIAPVAVILGILLGLAVFLFGTWKLNRDLDRFHCVLDAGVMLCLGTNQVLAVAGDR